jgi:ABC-type polysaccharide/polyol phosphate export permease
MKESFMNANVGTVDRILRIVVGLILIAMVFVGPQTSWGWIGVVPLLTALIGFCPAYKLIGLSTCPMKK